MVVGRWYTLTLDVDIQTGFFEAKVLDAIAGDLLNSVLHAYAGWDPAVDSFTSITMFDGGNVNSALQGQSTIGNVEYTPFDPDDCPANFAADGVLNFFDVSIFLAAFSAQDSTADFTGDDNWNFFDVSAFLTAFNAGCP